MTNQPRFVLATKDGKPISSEPATLTGWIEKYVAEKIQAGTRVTDWQKFALYTWAARNPFPPSRNGKKAKTPYAELRFHNLESSGPPIPIICNCCYCGGGALIFPAEEGVPAQYPQGDGGFCICPCCTFNDCEHKQARKAAR
ncbi:MAG TPA: hypothetical protein VF447_17535 [Terriglobales bacterium]